MKFLLIIIISLFYGSIYSQVTCNSILTPGPGSVVLASGVTASWTYSVTPQSYNCTDIEYVPFFLGSGCITVSFDSPIANPTFTSWGVNGNDEVAVDINGVQHCFSSANGDVVSPNYSCNNPTIPGFDPIGLVEGSGCNLDASQVGNSNYGYQLITLNVQGVNSITLCQVGVAGSGSGFGFCAEGLIGCNAGSEAPIFGN